MELFIRSGHTQKPPPKETEMDLALLKSILLKGVYVVLAAALTALAAFVSGNPDMSLWSIAALKLAVITAVVAAVKKWVANFFVV
jgi:hypothetical protein